MKSDILKKIIAAGALFALVCTLGNAQSAPNASVDPNTGELILLDDMGMEISRVPKPAGDVVNGDLVIDGVTIPAPNGAVQGDGSLYLPDTQETLQVPILPVDLFFTRGKIPVPGYYWSNIIGTYYDLGSLDSSKQGWIYIEKWGGVNQANGWFWVNTRTSEEAMWCYSVHFQSWVFFYVGQGGYKRLANPADFQSFAAFFVANPAAGYKQWHIFNANAAGAASYRRTKSDDSGFEWITLTP